MRIPYAVFVLLLTFSLFITSPSQAIGDVITRDNASTLSLFDTITTAQAIYSVAWSPDNNDLVFGLADGTVLQETLLPARASMPALLGGHTDAVTSVDVSSDGVWAFSVSMDGTVRAWERSTGIMQTASGLFTSVGDPFLLSVAARPFSPSEIAYTGQNSSVIQRVWDAPVTGPPSLSGHTNFVFDVEYSPDGALLATGGADASVRVWDYLSGTQQSSDTISHVERVYDVAFSRSGHWLVSTGQDRRIAVRPVLSPGEPSVLVEVPDPTGDTVVNAIDVGLDGDIVAVGDSNGILRIYSMSAPAYIGGELLFEMDTGDDQIRDLAISPDGTMIATAGFDSTLEIWNIPSLGTPPVLPTLPAPPAPITGDYCTGAPSSRLAIGMRARVTYTDGTTLRVRSAPGEAIIAEMAEGTEFTVIGGPLCLDGFTWWQLQLDDGTVGWSAEGDTSDYYIEPTSSSPVATGATISGTVWHDICDNSGTTTIDFCTPLSDGTFVADGFRARVEPVIPSVAVQLGEGACPIATSFTETLTAPDGTYQFNGISAGTYCLFINPSYGTNSITLIPGDWTYPLFLDPITGTAYQSITVSDGATVGGVEFGWDFQYAP